MLSCFALPMRNGNGPAEGFEIQPSRLYLPKLETPPATIFEHLLSRFPQVQPNVWRDRISRGLVTLSDGAPLQEDSPYRHGITVFYRKEVPSEPEVREEAFIIYRDENILIVDRKSTRLNSSHGYISYAVFCLKKKSKFGEALILSSFNYKRGEIY